MAITAGSDILASDFISSSAGAGDVGKSIKLNAAGQIDSTFLNLGTGANQIMQMTAGAKAPAVDGSLLTNLAPSYQRIPYYANSSSLYTIMAATSENDGSVVYVVSANSGGSTAVLKRFKKDIITGLYYEDVQEVTTSTAIYNGGNKFSIVQIGTYVYVIYGVSSANIRRFDKADFANETTITMAGTNTCTPATSFTDGTDIFINDGSNVARKYTISGTTATGSGSDTTYTSSGNWNNGGVISNGTNVWILDFQGSASISTIRKYAVVGGAIVASLNIGIATPYVNETETKLILLRSGTLGLLKAHTENSPTAIIGTVIEILPITAP